MRISFATHMPWSTPVQPAPTHFREQIINELSAPTSGTYFPGHGRKKHTLRRMKGTEPRFRPGMKLQFVQGPRYEAKQFAVAECESVQLVQMRLQWQPGNGYALHVDIDGEALGIGHIRSLARNDGFVNERDFYRWFLADLLVHGPTTYELIHWTPDRY